MKIMMDHVDVTKALHYYAMEVLHLQVDEGGAEIQLRKDKDGFSAIITGMSPSLVVKKALPVVAPLATVEVATTPRPKPLTQALDEVRNSVDWVDNSAQSTELSALGKGDPADFTDEIVGRPVPFAGRS